MLRFILYLACMVSICAAIVLTLVPYKYEKKKWIGFPANLAGMLCSLAVLSTSYYLSEFSTLLGERGDYNFAERFLDLLSTFSLFYFWLRAVHWESSGGSSWISRKKYYRIIVLSMGLVYLTYAIAYLFFVDDQYHVIYYYKAVVALQYVLTCSTTVSLFIGMACVVRIAKGEKERTRALHILFMGIIILFMTLYNGIMSLLIFKGQYNFEHWIGSLEFNAEFQLAAGLLLLSVAAAAYKERIQESVSSLPQAENILLSGTPDKMLQIMQDYSLSEREQDVAALLYERLTYEMIGEKLHISKYTVKRHVHNIYEKMEVSRRTDFIRKIDG